MNQRYGKGRQEGFSIVVAIFILVILGSLGSYMLSTSMMQQKTTLYAIQGSRAYKAAQSGIQWGVHQALLNAGTRETACGELITSPPVTTNIILTPPGLNNFDVDVQCSWTTHVDGGIDFCMFHLTAVARYGNFGELDFVSRTVEAVVTNRATPIAGSPGC